MLPTRTGSRSLGRARFIGRFAQDDHGHFHGHDYDHIHEHDPARTAGSHRRSRGAPTMLWRPRRNAGRPG